MKAEQTIRWPLYGVLLLALLLGLTAASLPTARSAAAATPGATPGAPLGATPTRLHTTPRPHLTPRPTVTPAARTPTATPAPVPATAAAGLLVYQRMGCTGCHKLAAAGSTGGYGPTHEHMAATAARRIQAADYAGTATDAAAYIAESITHPEVYVVPEYRKLRYRMPLYTTIRPDEVAALVAFLMEQR